MARILISALALTTIACAGAPVVTTAPFNPDLHDQKLLSDVVGSAFEKVDGLALRSHVNGKNVAVQVATPHGADTSLLRAHAGMLLTRAGASRADLKAGGEVVALVMLRAYGLQMAEVDGEPQMRGFVLGDLILTKPGTGEVAREPLVAKAVDILFSDGTRERRVVGRRSPEPEPEPSRAEEDERREREEARDREEAREREQAREREEARERERARDRDRESSRSRDSDRERDRDRRSRRSSDRRDRDLRSRRSRDRDEAEEDEEEEEKPVKRTRRRRRRQPLILE